MEYLEYMEYGDMGVPEFYALSRLEDASRHDGLYDEAADGKWDYDNQIRPLAFHDKRLKILNDAIAGPHAYADTHNFCSYNQRQISMGDIAIPDTCITTGDLDMSLLWSLYGGTTRVMNWLKIRYCEMTIDQLQSRLDAYERQHRRYYESGDHELVIAGSARCMLLRDAIKRINSQGKRKRFDMNAKLPPWGAGLDTGYLSKIASPFEQHHPWRPGPGEVRAASDHSSVLETSLLGLKRLKTGAQSPVFVLENISQEADLGLFSEQTPAYLPVNEPTSGRADSMSPIASPTFALQDITPAGRQSNSANLHPRHTPNSKSSGFRDVGTFSLSSPATWTPEYTERKMQNWLKTKDASSPKKNSRLRHDGGSPPAVAISLSSTHASGSNSSIEERQMASMLRHIDYDIPVIEGIDPSLEDHEFQMPQSAQYQQAILGLRGGDVATPKKRQCDIAETAEKRQKTNDSEDEMELYDSEHLLLMNVSEDCA